MLVYYMNLILTTVLNFASRILNKQGKRSLKDYKQIISNILCVLAILIATLVAGLRYGVGTDFFNYQDRFNHYIEYPNINIKRSNVGFGILIKAILLVTQNSQVLFIVTAFIINTLIILFIRKNTKLYDVGFYLFICLYFYCSSLNIMRQWISIAIFLYALKYAYDNKFIKYIIATLIATSFHITSLIMIPLYFLFRIKLNKKNMIILLSVIALLLILFYTVGVQIAEAFNMPEKYLKYMKFDSTLDGGGVAYVVFIIITLTIIGRNFNTYIKQNEYGEQQIKLLIIALTVSVLSTNSMIFNRMQLYFVPILAITIPNLIPLFEKKKTRMVVQILIMGLSAVYFYRCLSNNGGQILPYISVFDIM